MNRGTLITALALLLPLPTFAQSSKTPIQKRGKFSRDAISIWGQLGRQGILEIRSRNQEKIIVVKYGEEKEPILKYFAKVYVVVGGKQFVTDIGDLVGCEVAWAPDSKAFFVTYSDGGAVGTYHTEVYYVEETGLRIEEPTGQVQKDFHSKPPVCFEPEDPNIAAITWVGSSRRLLVAAEILPHSICEGMGTFKAYEISLPEGKILRKYGQLKAKRLFWTHLGPELRNASDECILNPKSCEIPALHPKPH